MGELSLGTGDLSHRRPVHGLARRPHADPPPGGPLRRTAGKCGSTERRAHTHTHSARPRRDPLPHTAGEREIMCCSAVGSAFNFSSSRSYQNAAVRFCRTQLCYTLWKRNSTSIDDNLLPPRSSLVHLLKKNTQLLKYTCTEAVSDRLYNCSKSANWCANIRLPSIYTHLWLFFKTIT